MKRYIGTWSKEQENVPEVAELIIDGNQIEFYRRDSGEIFPCAFVGSDGEHRYKVLQRAVVPPDIIVHWNMLLVIVHFLCCSKIVHLEVGWNLVVLKNVPLLSLS